MAPASFRRFIRGALDFPARRKFRASLAAKPFTPSTDPPAIHFGGVLDDGELVAGGKVKLLALREVFPEKKTDFNILYLVSSAPPRFAEDLVRWAKSKGARFVWNQNGVGYPAWAGGNTEEINRPMRRLLGLADFVVYQSEFCRESADRFLGRAPCESAVLMNPVDTEFFRPCATPLPCEPWRLLVAGTHWDATRVTRAIEAARLLIDKGHAVELTIAGGLMWRDAETAARRFVAEKKMEQAMHFVPAFSQQDATRLHQQSHVLLHLKYHDPCPTIVIESLACGVPVVGSRSGGLPELTGGESELIGVPVEWERAHVPGAAEISAAVEKIMRDRDARGMAARERAMRLFDKNAWVERHRAIFQKLIAR